MGFLKTLSCIFIEYLFFGAYIKNSNFKHKRSEIDPKTTLKIRPLPDPLAGY